MDQNIVSVFKSVIYNAVKHYLSDKKKQTSLDENIPTTLRISKETKLFYECLAQQESSSLNSVLTKTLEGIKEAAIHDYGANYTDINEIFDKQISSFLKVLKTCKIHENDIPVILEWLTDRKVTRRDILDKKFLIDVFDKEVQLKFCKIFGFSYRWLSNNSYDVNYIYNNGQYPFDWYKSSTESMMGLIKDIYTDDTVTQITINFLTDNQNIENVILKASEVETHIYPVIIIERDIKGVKFTNYRLCKKQDIGYFRCHAYFIALLKLIHMLDENRILDQTNFIPISKEQMDSLTSNRVSIYELYEIAQHKKCCSIDDLNVDHIKQPSSFKKSDDIKLTNEARFHHVLDISFIENLKSQITMANIRKEDNAPNVDFLRLDSSAIQTISTETGGVLNSYVKIKNYYNLFVSELFPLYEKSEIKINKIYTESDEINIVDLDAIIDKYNSLPKFNTTFG